MESVALMGHARWCGFRARGYRGECGHAGRARECRGGGSADMLNGRARHRPVAILNQNLKRFVLFTE